MRPTLQAGRADLKSMHEETTSTFGWSCFFIDYEITGVLFVLPLVSTAVRCAADRLPA